MNGFKFDASELAQKLGSMENKFDMAVSALADQGALAMQNSAKSKQGGKIVQAQQGND